MDKFNENKGEIIKMALNEITIKSSKVIEKVESLKKDFMELFNSDKDFFQLSFVNYTSLETFHDYNACNYRVCIENEKDIDEIINSMKSINEELKKYIDCLLNDTFSFDEHDKHSFNYFYRIGTDIGFSHISKHSRNKSRECEPWRFI